MKIKIEKEIKASEIELSEQELLDNFINNKTSKYSMFKIADKALIATLIGGNVLM